MMDTSSTMDNWTLVQKSKREGKTKISKDVVGKVRRLNGEYNLSSEIKNNKCIHCIVEKCREESHKNNNECPSIVTCCVTDPRTHVPGLSQYLIIDNLKEELRRKDLTIKWTTCLFNHCRNLCRNSKDDRCGFIQINEDEKLHYCYTDISGKNKIIYVSVHIDLLIREGTESPEILWKPLHNEKTENIESDDVSVAHSELSVRTTNTNKSGVKSYLSSIVNSSSTTSNNLDAVDVSKLEINIDTNTGTGTGMLSTTDVRELMQSPMVTSKSSYSNRTSNHYSNHSHTHSNQIIEMMKMMVGMNEEIMQLKEFIKSQNDCMRRLVDENTKLNDCVVSMNIRLDKLPKEISERQQSSSNQQTVQQQQNRDIQSLFRKMNNIKTNTVFSTPYSEYGILNN